MNFVLNPRCHLYVVCGSACPGAHNALRPIFPKSWFLPTPKIVWGGKNRSSPRVSYTSVGIQLEKGLGVTMWCLFLSTKMGNMPIVRRWGIKIVNYLRGFFFFFQKKTKDGEEK